MKRFLYFFLFVVPVVFGLTANAVATPIFTIADFTLPVQIIDYQNSPVGLLPDGTSIVNQYSQLGVKHDGSTTTPPGPSAISTLSGLPGLESDGFDPDPNLPITITFTLPVTQAGAFYAMRFSEDSITLVARRSDDTTIESVTVTPEDMPLSPGPFGFNEGFLGILANEPIFSLTFSPPPSSSSSRPLLIDDLHFAVVPEPSSFLLAAIGLLGMLGSRRRWAECHKLTICKN